MLLADNGWQQASLHDIVRLQLAVFAEDGVEIDGSEVAVPAPSVQPLGLAIHELAANAAVHGALSRPGGRLYIGWKRQGDGIVLDWEESGAVPAQTEPRKGFGNVLLGAVLERQLGGKVIREWRDDGLRLRVELPSLDRVGATLRSNP